MLTTSTEVNEIAAALAKAQGQMDNASKDRSNPAFKSKYADLASVRDAVCGPLSANGIACLQAAATTAEGVTVETRFIHTSGQWLACTVGAVPKAYDPQSIGSAITYLRRYGLMSMAGIAPEDDDGNAASGRHDGPPAWQQREPQRPAPREERREEPKPTQKWTDKERGAFCAQLTELGIGYDNAAAWCEAKGRPRPSLMEPAQRSSVLAYLVSPKGRADFDAYLGGGAK